jgi:hypothetical protein
MGKQFQVYLLGSDAVALIQTLRQKTDVHLVASRSSDPEPVELELPLRTQEGLSREDCLLAPSLPGALKLDHISSQGYWVVNTLFSEAIEFRGCHFDERTLKRGRFFYDRGFYKKAGHWQEKSPAFLKWAETVFATAKKSLTYIKGLDAYVGRDAERWHATGGLFVSLSIKGRPPVIAK